MKKNMRDNPAMRWIMLILIASLTFATYWFQDFLSGLKPLMESELHISSEEFGRLIQFTTLANVFGMIIIGGIVLDRWGIRTAGLLFGGVAVLGSLLTAVGASTIVSDPSQKLWVMMIGRLFFGIGLEVVCVIVSKTIVKWFNGYELALAFAINMALGRCGSGLATAFSIDIANGVLSPAANFAATLVCLSFLFMLIYFIFDKKLDKQMGTTNVQDPSERFKFADLLKLVTNRTFIFITLLCVAFYSAVFPFMQYAPDLLINKFGFSYELHLTGLSFWEKVTAIFHNGPKVAALIPLATILFTPIFGRIIDKKGKAASLMMLGALLLIFAHLALSVFNNVILGYFGLLSLGMAFSLVPAAMWPSVAKIVPENRLGTAYATMFTVQNWGLSAFFWGIGSVLTLYNPTVKPARDVLKATGLSMEEIIQKVPYNYTMPILMLVLLGVVSIIFAYQLKRADKKQNYGLELPSVKKA